MHSTTVNSEHSVYRFFPIALLHISHLNKKKEHTHKQNNNNTKKKEQWVDDDKVCVYVVVSVCVFLLVFSIPCCYLSPIQISLVFFIFECFYLRLSTTFCRLNSPVSVYMNVKETLYPLRLLPKKHEMNKCGKQYQCSTPTHFLSSLCGWVCDGVFCLCMQFI